MTFGHKDYFNTKKLHIYIHLSSEQKLEKMSISRLRFVVINIDWSTMKSDLRDCF